MFNFLKYTKLNILDSKDLSRQFMPEGLDYDKHLATCISSKHGRSIAIKENNFNWILIKGGGWNYCGPTLYRSTKDAELFFGLYDEKDATRELEVSQALEKISDNFPKVLYYKKFEDCCLPKEYEFLKTIRHTNGELVIPCLLYTQVRTPLRVADIPFFNDEHKKEIIETYSNYWNIEPKDFIDTFIKVLAQHVGIMHKNGFINDSLEYSNVTMLGEIIDYEWVTAPNILLPDGSKGDIIQHERKEKEILYAVEVVILLKSMLYQEYSLFEIYEKFIDEYRRFNNEYVESNKNIKKILNKERFIL